MNTFKFDELKLKQEDGWLVRQFRSAHNRKSAIAIVAGAGLGFLFYYLTEAQEMGFDSGQAMDGVLSGALLGFLFTNSPCARGKC